MFNKTGHPQFSTPIITTLYRRHFSPKCLQKYVVMLRGAPHDRIGELGLLTSNCVYIYIYICVCVCVCIYIYLFIFLIWKHIVYVCVYVNDCICMCEHLSPSGPTFVNLCFLGPCIQSMLHATLCEAKRPSLGYPHGRD